MATTVASKVPSASAPGAYDRVFYSGMAIAMALTVFVGFAPSYYLRFYFGASSPSGVVELSPLLHVHGVLFSSWVLLFIVQTALVAQRRVALHRRLGIAGVVLAAVMVVVGFSTATAAAARGSAPPGMDPLAFMAIPMADMVLFSTFVFLAVWFRKVKEAHKRLMLMAYISIIVAAIARWPGVLPLGPPAFFGLALVFVAAGIVYDLVTRRRVHPVYWWGGGLFVLSVPGRILVSGTETWRAFAEMVTR